MAEIKMDVTEYDSLRKNIELAEKRAKDLKEAQDKIEKLQQEKIDALKLAEKQVIYTRHTRHEEVMMTRKPSYNIMREMENFIMRNRRGSGYGVGSLSGGYIESSGYGVDYLISMFFDKKVVSNEPVQELITTKGLDEVKSELRLEIESKIDEETKAKLKRLAEVEPQLENLKGQVKSLEKKVVDITEEAMKASSEAAKSAKELDKLNKVYKLRGTFFNLIEQEVKAPMATFFGKSRKLKEINRLTKRAAKQIDEIIEED